VAVHREEIYERIRKETEGGDSSKSTNGNS
jgi:sRNA-binding carbon storage regulator CsrA